MLLSLKNGLLDRVDSRKIHSVAASRLGGASFLPAIIISTIVSSVLFYYFDLDGGGDYLSSNLLLIICSSTILYFEGIYDDIIGVRYNEKFLIQFFTALLVIWSGNYIREFNGLFGIDSIPPWVGVPLTILLIIFITNAINLIDGIDGLASMLSIMAFAMYAVMFYLNQSYTNCIVCLASMGALIPFWHHNVFGLRRGVATKIFMGDCGSLVIGFILSVMAIQLWNSSAFEGESCHYISNYSWVVAFTMLIIPCFDVLRVVVHRAKNHKPLFLPDKSHFHHKLMALGLSPRRSLMVLLSVNVLFLVVNCILATQHVYIALIIAFDVVLWILIHLIISRRILKNKNI